VRGNWPVSTAPRMSRLLRVKTLAGFCFAFQPSDHNRILRLVACLNHALVSHLRKIESRPHAKLVALDSSVSEARASSAVRSLDGSTPGQAYFAILAHRVAA
jgi:hypothetical protein